MLLFEFDASFYRFLICPIGDPKFFGSVIGHIKNL